MTYHNTIWIVKERMEVNSSSTPNSDEKRKIIIEKGEILEFRYPHSIHFRTLDNKYYVVSQEVFNKHCCNIGLIWDKVSWKNDALLEEIWRLKLFDWIPNGEEIYNRIKKELEVADK